MSSLAFSRALLLMLITSLTISTPAPCPGSLISRPRSDAEDLRYRARQSAKQDHATQYSALQSENASLHRAIAIHNPSSDLVTALPAHLGLKNLTPSEFLRLEHSRAELADRRSEQWAKKAERYQFKRRGGDLGSEEGRGHTEGVREARRAKLDAKKRVGDVQGEIATRQYLDSRTMKGLRGGGMGG